MQIIDVTPAAGLFASGAAGALRAADQRAAERKQQELQAAQAARLAADSARMERQMSLAERDFALQEQTVNQARADQTAITDSLMGQLRPQLGSRVAGLAPGQAGPPEAGAQLSPLEQSFRELERKYKGGEVSAGAAGEIASQLGKAAMQAEIEAKREEMAESILSSIATGKNTLSAHGITSVDGNQDGKPDDLDALHTKLFERLANGEDPDLIELELEMIEGQIATEVTRKQRQMVYADQMRNDLGMALNAGPNAMDAMSHTLANAVINRIESGKYKFGEEGRAWKDFTNAKMGQIPFPDDSPFAGAYAPPEVVMQYTGGAGGGRGRAMANPEDARMDLLAKGVDTLNKIIREPRREDYVNELGEVDSAGYAAAVEQYKSDRIAAAQRLGIGELFPAPKVEGAQGGAQGEQAVAPAIRTQPREGMVTIDAVPPDQARKVLEEMADSFIESGKNESALATKLGIDIETIAADPVAMQELERLVLKGGSSKLQSKRDELNAKADERRAKRLEWERGVRSDAKPQERAVMDEEASAIKSRQNLRQATTPQERLKSFVGEAPTVTPEELEQLRKSLRGEGK